MSDWLLRWWMQLLGGTLFLNALWVNLDADARALGVVHALLAAVFLFGAGSAWARRGRVGQQDPEELTSGNAR
jgi:hypothetical protein